MSQTTGAYTRIFRAIFRERGRFHQRHIDISVHGSCSRCHHFHINCLVPHDTTAHTRVRCEQCGHHMFGLGSSNTQYTLASVNTGTMFPPRGCVEEQPRQAGSQGETAAVEDTQNTSRHSPNPDQHIPISSNQMAESPEQMRRGNMQEPLRYTMRKRLKQWCSRPRKWSSSVRAMVQRLSNTARGTRPPTGPDSSITNNVSIGASSPPSISQTPPGDPIGEASESITRPESPSFQHHMDQPGDPTRERLRILRHDKTEQRARELRAQCLCGQQCFCINEGSPASNEAYIGSDSQTRFRMQIEGNRSSPQTDAPSHSLSGTTSETNGSPPSSDISQAMSLSYIGHQFEMRPLSHDMLGSNAEHSQRRSTFSLTPTINTNRSSITLSGRTASAAAARNQNISLLNPAPDPDIPHYLSANSHNATPIQDQAERGMAGASESSRGRLAYAALTTGAIQHNGVVEPNLISTSQASFESSPHHDSQLGQGYNAEGTSVQVDGIASEHTGEEESEADTSTR